MSSTTSKLSTCLWFDGQAEEAANHYTTIFPDSKILTVQRFGAAGHDKHGQAPGSVMVVEFSLRGGEMRVAALNGGPMFKHSPAVSFMVDCEDQAEVDYYWGRLAEGGDPKHQRCGWLSDRFGVSWQVVPRVLKEMISSPDAEKSQRVQEAMYGMTKMDIAALETAFEGKKEETAA